MKTLKENLQVMAFVAGWALFFSSLIFGSMHPHSIPVVIMAGIGVFVGIMFVALSALLGSIIASEK